jgi:hypothetical protein
MADEHHHQDPTFYRTPRDAAEAPPEKLAYVATFSRPADQPDAIAVLDVDPDSARYGSVVGFTELPHLGDELHHFGWNACWSPDPTSRPMLSLAGPYQRSQCTTSSNGRRSGRAIGASGRSAG